MGIHKKREPKKQSKTKQTGSSGIHEEEPDQAAPAITPTALDEFIQFTSVQKGELKIPNKSQLSKFTVPETDLTIDDTTMNLTAKLPGTTVNDLTLSLNQDSLIILSNNKQAAYYTEIKLPEGVIPQSAVAKFDNGTLNLSITKLGVYPEPKDESVYLSQLQREVKESKDKLSQSQKQFYAIQQDYQNLLVRSKKEVEDRIDAYKISVIEKLIKNIDHFELALKSASKNTNQTKNNDQILVGINLILNELKNMIKEEGVCEITGDGLLLDPLQHEVLDCEETDKYPENTILMVHQKGYKYKSWVIRPSKVKVSIQPKSKKKGKPKK
jgi:molecular chaperone GrpE